MLRHDIKLRSVIILMLVIASVITAFLLSAMYRTTGSYAEMEAATDDYIDSRNSAESLLESIDKLLGLARSFVVQGGAEYSILYCNELQLTRSRDSAREKIEQHLPERAAGNLEAAMALSDQLIETECYAMRLAMNARGGPLSIYPAALREIELGESDLSLSAEEQLLRAQALVFDDEYVNLKKQTDTLLQLCTNALEKSMKERQTAASDRVRELLRQQSFLIYGLMLTLLVVAVIIFSMVIVPLTRQVDNIGADLPLDVRGTEELKFLARTYNEMYEETHRTHERLSYEAMHDALTGLFNRNAYDTFCDEIKDESVGLMLIDVDLFKRVNDTRGHQAGDKVLKRVAGVLEGAFRGEDRVCRIGGDEFAVLLHAADSSSEPKIRERMRGVMEMLSRPEDGLPPVTLSVGVAFSDQLREGENLFRSADRVLYEVKASGRNGCQFYQPHGSGAA